MATHSSVLAWRIPRTEEPGGLRSIQSQRVGRIRWQSSVELTTPVASSSFACPDFRPLYFVYHMYF